METNHLHARVHKAGWVVATPEIIIETGYIHAVNGRIVDVGKGHGPSGVRVVDHGPGILTPGLVNTHTHLELSALHGQVCRTQGFETWVRELLAQRETVNRQDLAAGAAGAAKGLYASGCRVVGDVSTLGLSGPAMEQSGLAGIRFQEHLGTTASFGDRQPDTGLVTTSLAGHAPHTTAPKLLQKIKAITQQQKRPMAIHVSESAAETAFITTGQGAWSDFIKSRGIDHDDWPLPAASPIQYLDRLGLLDRDTLVVHALHADDTDIAVLANRQTAVCLCPRSNQNLHQRLPDLQRMLAAGLQPALGTDSLASVRSLSMWDELAFAARSYQQVDPAVLFAMATCHGARALGLHAAWGTLTPGKKDAPVYRPLHCNHRRAVIETIVHNTQ